MSGSPSTRRPAVAARVHGSASGASRRITSVRERRRQPQLVAAPLDLELPDRAGLQGATDDVEKGGGRASSCCSRPTHPVSAAVLFPQPALSTSAHDARKANLRGREPFVDQVDTICADPGGQLTGLDGVDLYGGDLAGSTWMTVFEPFDVDLPNDPDNFADWFGLVGGTTPAINVGYYARTGPLSVGEHVLEFGGTLCSDGEVWFETHANYQIHVQ